MRLTSRIVRASRLDLGSALARLAAIVLAFGTGAFGPVASSKADGGLVGVAVYDAGRLVVDEQADLRLTPASVQKAIIAAVALERLGPQYRARTTVGVTVAPDGDGTVDGDLVLRGGADPTWGTRVDGADAASPLARLAAVVRAQGVRRVDGDLVLDVSVLPPPHQPTSRPLSDMVLSWSAPVSAVALDEGTLRLGIAPGKAVGGSIDARWSGGANADRMPAIRNRAWTVDADRHDRGTVAFLPGWDDDTVTIIGEYPISEPRYDVPLADPHPARRVGHRFRTALAEIGVVVEGSIRVVPVSVPVARTLGRVDSPPLVAWLSPILEDSANWLCEMLLRHLAIASGSSGRLEDALARVAETLTETIGIDAKDFVLDDGSGLSSENLITARAVARVFDWAWSRPWRAAFVDALPAPGEGTLGSWPQLPPVWAKTGTKRQVAALAGYLQRADGTSPRAFAILLDHRLDSTSARRREIARRLSALTSISARASSATVE